MLRAIAKQWVGLKCGLIGASLASGLQTDPVLASPAQVFLPHLSQLKQALLPGYKMRLPNEILLGGPADDDFINSLDVRISTSRIIPSVTIGLYSCNDLKRFCFVGDFSVLSPASAIAQKEFMRHQLAASPITLSPTIRAYLLEGQYQQPRSIFSSVMWQQDNLLYQVRFAYPERQNILYMALSMVNSQPVYAARPLREVPAALPSVR